MLPQIRQRGQKAVIVDVSGAFVDRYYREGDIILNPFDERGVPWHPWGECRDQFDLDSMAESLIPESHNERELYWRTAAKSLFSVVLDLTSSTKNTSDLTRWILQEPLANLCDFVAGTKAASFVDINSEKTAGSIRSVAASFLECLSHLEDTESPFSIRDWVQKDDDDSWLFLYSTPGQRSTLKSLLGCWFSVAVRSLLQLPPDLQRRLWFVIDELPSLNRIKDLELFLAEARKYGGCATLALQSPAQLEAIYGREGAQMIIGNSATKIVFSERDPEVSERISKAFGTQEIQEYQEGISYGAHEMRDGVSLSKRTRQRPVVSANDIQSLKNNQAYIRLPGNLPVTKIKLPIVGGKE